MKVFNLSKKDYLLYLAGEQQKVKIQYNRRKDNFFIEFPFVSISGNKITINQFLDGKGTAEIWNNGNLTAVLDFVSIEGLDLA